MKFLLLLLLPFVLFASKPKLLLLQTYKDQNISGWVMSEKLDGIRAYWDGKHLISRGGKIIHAPEWFVKDYPPFAIDGELWSKRGDFENISSIVRDKVPGKQWREITHNIFEVPNAAGGLFQRLAKVKPYESKYIKIIPQKRVKNKEELQKFLKSVEKKGGEGVVVRDPNAAYINKRTSKALKVKSFFDTECKVVKLYNGKGKYSNVLGSLLCELSNGVRFKIGSGFSDKERRNPPKVEDIITFKYKSFTKYGKPRFPIFLRVRNAQ
ncbi:DNA ligase [Sulfurimonas sp.]